MHVRSWVKLKSLNKIKYTNHPSEELIMQVLNEELEVNSQGRVCSIHTLFLVCLSSFVGVSYLFSVLFLKILLCKDIYFHQFKSESSGRYFDMVRICLTTVLARL